MVRLENIKKVYYAGKENELAALRNVSFEIKKGEMTAITGKSGAGKSTLLHILACIDNYDAGNYYLDGRLIWRLSDWELAKIRNERIGMVMQDFALVEEFSVLENVMLPLDFGKRKKNKTDTALEALKEVGMERLAEQPAGELSGGQKQRAAIARAIVNHPDIILADEPTGALDSESSEMIMEVFKRLHQEGKTILIVTHDPGIAEQCERVIKMKDGVIAE